MTNPMPVESIPLEYDRAADPWRPAVRLMAVGVVAQGVTMLAPAGYVVWETTSMSSVGLSAFASREGPVFAVELLRAALGIGLVVCGTLALWARPAGRTLVLWLEPVATVLVGGEMSAYLWQTYQMLGGSRGSQWATIAVQQVVYSLSGFVLPALVWAFFRRPETRSVTDRSR